MNSVHTDAGPCKKCCNSRTVIRITVLRESNHFLCYDIFSRVLRDSTPRFVGPSVRPLVRPSVRHARVENAKNAYLGCCSWYCLCVSVLEGGWGCGWGEAGGWMPLPTRPQRYCDPASLVFFLVHYCHCLYLC